MNDVDDWGQGDELEAAEEIGDSLPIVMAAGALGEEDMDALFERVASRLSPLEAEGLGNAMRRVGRWASSRQVRDLAGGLLPIAGTAVGTIYGGPAGAAIGGTLGKTVGQAIGGGGRSPQKARPGPGVAAATRPAYAVAPVAAAPGVAGEPAPQVPEAPPDGSTAAARFLYLVQNPAFLSSLASLALGPEGARAVQVGDGGTQVPVGAFMNLASTLVAQATQDADALAGDQEEAADGYLRDRAGRLTVDPVVPEARADALLRLLQEEDDSAESNDSGWDEDGDFTDDEPWLG